MSRKKTAAVNWGGLMDLRKAQRTIGGLLSATRKMPGYSYNLAAVKCVVGSRLRKIEGSVCEKCYAFRGHYQYPVVQNSMRRHMAAIKRPDWVPAMVTMINWWCRSIPFFRWHDSGDLQSVEHLHRINEIAKATPIICHWLPTREVKMVRTFMGNYETASNLCIRISEPMIEERTMTGSCLKAHAVTSGVAPRHFKKKWKKLVKTNTNDIFFCLAPLQEGQCKECRACWQQEVKHVVYIQK